MNATILILGFLFGTILQSAFTGLLIIGKYFYKNKN
jgi:hypothetical protein